MNLNILQRFTAFFISIITMLCNWLNLPLTPMGQKLDLTGYELVFCEEFDGDSLNRDVWNFTPPFNGCISSENSFEGYNLYGAVFNEQMLEFSEGTLTMHIKYCESGIEGSNAKYYCAPIISSAKSFNPVYGYFEYGLLWEPTGYTFYVDGVESLHTDYAVSRSPEHLILSYALRKGAEDDVPSDKVYVDNGDGKFIIDYVKAYQKP